MLIQQECLVTNTSLLAALKTKVMGIHVGNCLPGCLDEELAPRGYVNLVSHTQPCNCQKYIPDWWQSCNPP